MHNQAATLAGFAVIASRSWTTASPPLQSIGAGSATALPFRSATTMASTSAAHARKMPRNHFTSSRTSRQDDGQHPKRKAATKHATKNSLRKVALDAQRSRLVVRRSGKTRYVHPEADTKDVTAYCAAETYNLSRARWELQREGHAPDPCGTRLFPQVLHFQTQNSVVKEQDSGGERPQGAGDVFVFPSGCVVTWNVPELLARKIVTRYLPVAAGDTGHLDKMEIEDLEYIEDESKESSRIIGDTIILGTKPSDHYNLDSSPESAILDNDESRTPEVDTILAKIAFSSALARSTKLAVLENSLSHYFSTTRNIPLTLASGKKLKINRSQILQKTGELLLIRAQLNLYSELTDSLPDLFWDSPHELGLEGYYEMVGRALDVGVRIKVLNEKMDYASEIAGVLSQRLSEKHSSMLEWTIILLICIEVGFGIVHLSRESKMMDEMDEEKRTRELLQVWLQREVKGKEV
ncbi:MIOREX complex component 10 [Fulvia fulva]|uniref:MIOREX complex component 10 n=1 Tax=Passalora fulva TaxID=5499 RepID=A0A9Q8UVF1_PASFU|nr:MIOREX complex component 10 [Fulvia fulva]KAK4611528.1 MIOREX complex component 10 [Fulvia fulva]KAK4612571.1 MIOREX complex component 10 [Fulvia fulva]UJO23903.1 MIOREX complex component 10 [Fulvia fulva]WPV21172.1 MIOREX complex component 10 [Fulvia fulva]WPV35874.1 MIOREX complex component 10 [Fulvia fulva]